VKLSLLEITRSSADADKRAWRL